MSRPHGGSPRAARGALQVSLGGPGAANGGLRSPPAAHRGTPKAAHRGSPKAAKGGPEQGTSSATAALGHPQAQHYVEYLKGLCSIASVGKRNAVSGFCSCNDLSGRHSELCPYADRDAKGPPIGRNTAKRLWKAVAKVLSRCCAADWDRTFAVVQLPVVAATTGQLLLGGGGEGSPVFATICELSSN